MEYQIITVCNKGRKWKAEMEEEVAKAIAEGWKPLGGISATDGGMWTTSYQAMVKE